MAENALGRLIPEDWTHVERYPFAVIPPRAVEAELPLPSWHNGWSQNGYNACVGFSCSMMMAIANLVEDGVHRNYDEFWLWNQAKAIDDWSFTNPGDNQGTSVRAACQILKAKGHVLDGQSQPSLDEGILEYRWARYADEVRAALGDRRIPVVIGINWYSGFDSSVVHNGERWIGLNQGDWGAVRGGHAVCLYATSDQRQAVKIKNSWAGYPEVWLPYTALDRLLREQGEACLVTDRTRAPSPPAPGPQPPPAPPTPPAPPAPSQGPFFAARRSGIFHRRSHRGIAPYVWFASWGQAMAQGYRPCNVCRPGPWGEDQDDG